MGANDAAEQLAVAIEEVGKLERENADLSKRLVWNLKRADTAQAERDAALAVIEQARVEQEENLKRLEFIFSHDATAMDVVECASEFARQSTLTTSPADALDALDAVKFAAWNECLDAIEKHELNTEQARSGNPYRNPRTPGGEASGQASP